MERNPARQRAIPTPLRQPARHRREPQDACPPRLDPGAAWESPAFLRQGTGESSKNQRLGAARNSPATAARQAPCPHSVRVGPPKSARGAPRRRRCLDPQMAPFLERHQVLAAGAWTRSQTSVSLHPLPGGTEHPPHGFGSGEDAAIVDPAGPGGPGGPVGLPCRSRDVARPLAGASGRHIEGRVDANRMRRTRGRRHGPSATQCRLCNEAQLHARGG
ncbi:hypothetical protein SAMN05444746_1277 [Variovorax sp. OK212]|nr:hypothetical protein SAMN05518853_1277 [Variovorax sp. OK202]SFE51872.1 hypothetical protein SAMN05444746_1277 [Variovorax sp. OK212]